MLESMDMGLLVEMLCTAVLAAGAKEVAGGTVKSTVATGKKILGWLQDKLPEFPAQGLKRACEKPESDRRWETFKTQLQDLIEEDSEFAAAFTSFLKETLPEAVGDTITQTATVGDGANKVNIVQIGKGSGNTISLD